MALKKSSYIQNRDDNAHNLQQIFKAKLELSAIFIEDARQHLSPIIEVLRNKALGGCIKSIEMYLNLAIEKSPERLYIETNPISVETMGERDLSKAAMWYYDMKMKKTQKEQATIEHTPILESRSDFSAPPLQENPSISPADFFALKSEQQTLWTDPLGLKAQTNLSQTEDHAIRGAK
jgi:hypothetical protein